MTPFEKGVQAYGTDRTNPYDEGTDEHEEWQDGWNEAAATQDPEVVDNL